jgi:hypothetical protein
MTKKEQPGCITSLLLVIFLIILILWIYHHWISAIVWLGISSCVSSFIIHKITGKNAEPSKKDKRLSDSEFILGIIVFLLPLAIFIFNYLTSPVTFKEFDYEECRKDAASRRSMNAFIDCERQWRDSIRRGQN